MNLEKIKTMIDEALTDGYIQGNFSGTAILNAEFALGKYFALMDVIWELYGVSEYLNTYDRTIDKVQELTDRTEKIYGKGATA